MGIQRQQLRTALEKGTVLVPGAANALTARIIEMEGFSAVYVTGAGIANAQFGVPDLGLISFSEMLTEVSHIASATSLPLVVDADTGYGGVLNVRRTVEELESAGATAVQLEDQAFPKRCGHFDGKSLVSASEMRQRISAAVDARSDPNLLIVARTDAIAVGGLEDALERGRSYVDAGADVLFVESPASEEDFRIIGESFRVPLVANMVEGGKSPVLSLEQLAELGFTMVLYANTALRAAMRAMTLVLRALKEQGSSIGLDDMICTWEERQAIVKLSDYLELEQRYSEVERKS